MVTVMNERISLEFSRSFPFLALFTNSSSYSVREMFQAECLRACRSFRLWGILRLNRRVPFRKSSTERMTVREDGTELIGLRKACNGLC